MHHSNTAGQEVNKKMKMFATVITVAIIGLIFQVEPALSNNHSRIVNGALVPLGQIPYQVSLQRNGGSTCGGSILNARYVLTAAHCLSSATAKELKVIAGTVNLDDLKSPASVHSVTKILMHTNYEESNSWNNDIALLKVTPPFKFNKYISAAKLPSAKSVIKESTPAIISGFGKTSIKDPGSPKLLKTNVYVMSQENCKKIQKDIRPTNICTNNVARVTGFCNGDSGGPLTVNGRVVGIVSYAFNFGCAGADQTPQVFTRVSKYINWISTRISK